jgi:DNA-binding NtrC family response regulator
MTAEILVVDDEADIRELVGGILQDEGYIVRTAGNSADTLAAVRTRAPRLVVLDVWLKGSELDGLGILSVLKEMDPFLPVVVISGHGTVETAVEAIRRGAGECRAEAGEFEVDGAVGVIARAGRTLERDGAAGKLGREGCGDQQPDHDFGTAGLGQGPGGAPDPRSLEPRQRTVRGDQHSLDRP